MLQQVEIYSSRDFDFMEYAKLLEVKNLVLSISPEEVPDAWGFYRKGQSTTLFSIERSEGEYVPLSKGLPSSRQVLCLCGSSSRDG